MRDEVTRRGKRTVINARVSQDTRHWLRQAADHSGRSLSDELERRLRLTFVDAQVATLDDVDRALSACLSALQKLRVKSRTDEGESVAPEDDTAAGRNDAVMRQEVVRGKTAVLNALVSQETRSWLKQAADDSRRSMADELERRLRLTFVDDCVAGLDEIERALSACRSALQKLKAEPPTAAAP